MKTMTRLLVLALALICLAVPALASEIDADKEVKKVEVITNPVKTAYVVGEEFTLEGGVVLVTYDDDTTEEIPMTDDGLSIKEPGMKAPGTKTVTIKAGKKSARFTIDVANNSFKVTYEQNYAGAPEAQVVDVVKGQKAEAIVPVREGYTFVGWYVNPDFTSAFDFKTEITADVTLYALWKKDGVEHVDVTFDYGFYGWKLNSYSYPVEVGTAVAQPVSVPERVGYAFAAWVDETGAAYDFSKPVTAAMTLKATWTKTVSGTQTWIFEAEDSNLSGKTGPAVSGTANEIGMIIGHPERNASGDRSVGYLYQYGNSLEFYIACDAEMTDVTLSLSLSAEMEDLTLDPSTYGIYLNDERLNYGVIVIDEVPAFDLVTYQADVPPYEFFVIAQGVTLREGKNLVRLVTENNQGYNGTTMLAHAPLVDCLKVETEGVVIWDENYGVPALDNYER